MSDEARVVADKKLYYLMLQDSQATRTWASRSRCATSTGFTLPQPVDGRVQGRLPRERSGSTAP